MTPSPQQYRRLSKYELHQLIGEGAMGVVWKAYDSVLRRFVALKLLNTVGRTQDARERFLREARAAGALQHPNIVTIYDLGEAERQLFIAMELVEGRDLSEIIAAAEPLPLERKLDISIELLDGLHYAHQRGVIHRDVKPSNVRIAADGGVKIMDFGIARLQSADATGSGAIIGTPTYMAPEQITNGAITPATDVFAVGCLLYELLAYRKPFEGESIHGVLYQVLTTDPKALRTMAPSIPASLERVVMKAMNKVPEDRYANGKEMRQTLLGIRAALSGATDDTTQRLGPRWTPIPSPLLKLVTHTPMKWRVVVLSALVLVVAALVLLPTTPTEPIAASSTPTGGTVMGPASPGAGLMNPAFAALRDSARAARDRAERAGAMKNGVRSWRVAEAMRQAADQAVQTGDLGDATQGWRESVALYRTAEQDAIAQRREVQLQITRVTPVVQALGTRAEAGAAAAALARAESLLAANDFTLSRLETKNVEEIGVASGIAPPSPQPEGDARRAIEVVLQDLARAVASERVTNIRLLYPTLTTPEAAGWETFFRRYEQIRVRYTIRRFRPAGLSAEADVDAVIAYAGQGGGPPGEDRPQFRMRFTQARSGWRVARVLELK